MKKKGLYQKSKKVQYKISKCFTFHETKTSNFLIIILQLHLRLNIKQIIQKKSKYQHINKCFKDNQCHLRKEKQVINIKFI